MNICYVSGLAALSSGPDTSVLSGIKYTQVSRSSLQCVSNQANAFVRLSNKLAEIRFSQWNCSKHRNLCSPSFVALTADPKYHLALGKRETIVHLITVHYFVFLLLQTSPFSLCFFLRFREFVFSVRLQSDGDLSDLCDGDDDAGRASAAVSPSWLHDLMCENKNIKNRVCGVQILWY